MKPGGHEERCDGGVILARVSDAERAQVGEVCARKVACQACRRSAPLMDVEGGDGERWQIVQALDQAYGVMGLTVDGEGIDRSEQGSERGRVDVSEQGGVEFERPDESPREQVGVLAHAHGPGERREAVMNRPWLEQCVGIVHSGGELMVCTLLIHERADPLPVLAGCLLVKQATEFAKFGGTVWSRHEAIVCKSETICYVPS